MVQINCLKWPALQWKFYRHYSFWPNWRGYNPFRVAHLMLTQLCKYTFSVSFCIITKSVPEAQNTLCLLFITREIHSVLKGATDHFFQGFQIFRSLWSWKLRIKNLVLRIRLMGLLCDQDICSIKIRPKYRYALFSAFKASAGIEEVPEYNFSNFA